MLDFRELEQWRELLRANGMVTPPAIRMDVASDLNAAYSAEAPLKSFLKQHRLLALARAPLAARIHVLRQIRLADIMSPVWTDDLQILETARHQELQRELTTAVRTRLLDRATEIATELNEDGWVHAPPQQLVSQARQQSQQLAAVLAAEEMERIEKELADAYTALDVEAGRVARAKWASCQQVAGLSNQHPLVRRAAAALAWLEEEDGRRQRSGDFTRAVANLESALETDSSRDKLERLFHAVRRFDEEVPPLLARRYYDRVQALDITVRRRFTLAATVGVLALLLIAAGIGWYIYDAQREEAVGASSRALARLIDDQNVVEAQRYYDDLHRKDAFLAARPEIQQELRRLSGQVSAEATRKESFATLLNQAMNAGLDDPDRSSLIEAEKIAKLPDEKSKLADWRAKTKAADRERQQQRDQQFESEYEMLLVEVTALERAIETRNPAGGSGAPQLFGQIDQLLARIGSVRQSASGVSAALLSQLDPLQVRVSALRRQVSADQQQLTSLQRINAAVGRPDAYLEALENYISVNPQSPLAGEFKRVAEEVQWWRDIDRWKAFLGDFRFSNLGKIDPKNASEILKRGEVLLKEAGESPSAFVFKSKQPFLQHVAGRVDQATTKPTVDALETIFEQRPISNVWMLKQLSRQRQPPEVLRYYLRDKPDLSESKSGSYPLRVFLGFDLSEKTQSIRENEIEQVDSAPQSKIAAEVKSRDLFRRIKDGEWERGFYEFIQLVSDQKDMDSLLQVVLLRRLLEIGRQGSHSLDEAFGPMWSRLESADVDYYANWIWPHDENGVKSRDKANELVKKLPSAGELTELGRRAAGILEQDIAPLTPFPNWIGRLHSPITGAWACEAENPIPKDGELFVIVSLSNSSGTGPGWQRVGVCEPTGILWDNSRDGRLLTGRPVYHFAK